jgi:hypothetical protein
MTTFDFYVLFWLNDGIAVNIRCYIYHLAGDSILLNSRTSQLEKITFAGRQRYYQDHKIDFFMKRPTLIVTGDFELKDCNAIQWPSVEL